MSTIKDKKRSCETSRKVRFTKMHGAANDYIYLNGFEYEPEDPGELAREISDRHRGMDTENVVHLHNGILLSYQKQ